MHGGIYIRRRERQRKERNFYNQNLVILLAIYLVSQIWRQRFKPAIGVFVRNDLSLILSLNIDGSASLFWTILSILHHHLRIKVGARLRTCNADITTFGTCVTCFATSLWCGKYSFNLVISLSLFSVNPHKHLRQQEQPDCKPSSLVKDPGGPVQPTRRRGFPRQRVDRRRNHQGLGLGNRGYRGLTPTVSNLIRVTQSGTFLVGYGRLSNMKWVR